MTRAGVGLAAVASLLLACSQDRGVDELVRELRAERLARREAAQVSARAISEDVMAATMAPLQAALSKLLERQDELAQRQSRLATELRAWVRLAVDSEQQEQVDRAEELSRRLAEMEAVLEAEATRHGEVEKLLGEALEKASAQLRALILRLGQEPPKERDAPPGAPQRASGEGASGDRPGQARAPVEGEPDRQANLWPMWGVAAFAFGAGAWLLAPRRQPGVLEASAPAAADPEPAVARAPAGVEAERAEAQRVEEGRVEEGRPPTPGRVTVRIGPGSARTEQQVRDLLTRDGRVLSRPAPELARDEDGWTVRFALLPGVSAGERGRLQQRLRDLAR